MGTIPDKSRVGYERAAGSATSQIDDARPDAWDRFRRAVHAASESGPMHKVAPQSANKKERPASKGRVHKGKTHT